MPIEPVKIPQNVQIEDRLVGPITLRQTVICMVGGGISFVLWNAMKSMGLSNMLYVLIGWSPLGIAAAFAFIKIQNISLLRLILLFIEKGDKPATRIWTPRTGVAINIRTYFGTRKNAKSPETQTIEKDKFKHLSSVLDEGGETEIPDSVPGPNQDKNKEIMETDEAVLQPKEAAGDENEQNRPVDPGRVSVEPLKTSVDGIGTAQSQNTQSIDFSNPPS